MAKPGSCKIGFKPKPSFTITEFIKKGFEVKTMNNPNRTCSADCIKSVTCLKFKSIFFVNEKKNPYIDNIDTHSSIDPSWLPQVPEILYISGLFEWEFWKTLKFEKSETMYAYINEKNEIMVKTEELRKTKSKLKLFFFKKIFEKIRNIFAPIAKDKQTKPTSELINIFYSNNQNFLNLI